ncbi:MAG: HAMP domain-containing protein [Candidatus Kerfeldbacteria bacterium]|nr:HAMP domain-containing protein [Candidatus Kerfeldbacteria bacterium]
MSIAIIEQLRNVKIKHKIVFIFGIVFILLLNLGVLNIFSIRDIQQQTEKLSVQTNRLIQTSNIKDNLNLSILAANEYVRTGDVASKKEYENAIRQALIAQVELFSLSQSQSELEFTQSFETHINAVYSSLNDLIEAYENGASNTVLASAQAIVSKNRDAFSNFVSQEVEDRIQQFTSNQEQSTAYAVQKTITIVSIIGFLAFIVFIFISIFMRRAVTQPLEQLTAVAHDIGQGRFRPATVDSHDELGVFADTFNIMIQRIQATQESLKIELEKTRKLDQQKTEFLSIAAHQLRTPISGIKWLISMTVDGDLGDISPEAKNQLKKGLDNINRMTLLINSLLDVLQVEAKKLTYETRSVELVPFIQELFEEFDTAAKETGIIFTVEKPTTPLPAVSMDPEKMKLAFHNIIDNAIKYTPKGGTVDIAFEKTNDEVLTQIRDTGYGIPAEEQDRLFTKFYRGSNIQTIQADGSGLGLFLAHEIITQQGGDIIIESAINKGTKVIIHLPIAPPTPPAA